MLLLQKWHSVGTILIVWGSVPLLLWFDYMCVKAEVEYEYYCMI